MGKQVGVGIIGLGTVGGGALKVLVNNKELIASRSTSIVVSKICDLNQDLANGLIAQLGLDPSILTTTVDELLNDPAVDIVIELIGGIYPAKDMIIKALKQGKSVVTANKDLLAAHGAELFRLAEEKGVDLLFEPSVAGAVPVIKALKDSLAGNHVLQVMGIVNGTTNYILSEMTATGADFSACLKQAQDLGYAEADPTNDVEGIDAARKMAILATIAFNTEVTVDMVYVEGIKNVTKFDIAYADQLGYAIKLLGIAKADEANPNLIEVRVHPALIEKKHPLATVQDAFNAVFIEGDALGTSMFYGRGAGELPTASAVVGDVIAAAQNVIHNTKGLSGCRIFNHKAIKPMNDIITQYYIRLMVLDEPRVLGQIADVIGVSEVSLDAVIQKRIVDSGLAEIVLITHQVKEENMQKAMQAVKNLACVDSVASLIRVNN